jgi:ABC-2 type transport system permease protein
MTALSDQARPDDLWPYAFKLMRLRWQLFAGGFVRAKPFRKFSYIFLWLLILGAFAGIYLLAAYLFGLVNSPLVVESGLDVNALLESIPALSLSGVFMALLLTSFSVLLQGLYLANDMDFLLTSPIPVRAVFLSKLLLAILPNFVLTMTFCLPILFSLGKAEAYNGLYYFLTFVVLAALSLATAGIASLFVMVIARFFPARRVAEVLALFTAAFFMVLSQLGNLTGINSGSFDPERIAHGVQVILTLNGNWSPFVWAGKGLIDLGKGYWASGIFSLGLVLSLASCGFWLTLVAAEHLYFSGWASMQVTATKKKFRRGGNHRTLRIATLNSIQRLRHSQVWAILLKDLKVFQRDLRFTSRMVMPLIMGIVFMVMMLRSNGNSSAIGNDASIDLLGRLKSFLDYGSMLPSLWVGSMLILSLGLIAFSVEGKSYWVIKTAPVEARRQLAAKFLTTCIPSLVLSWLFLLVASLLKRVPAGLFFYDLGATTLLLAGLSGIVLSIGVRGVNLHWDDPRRISVALVDTAGIISTLVYVIVAIGLFFVPPISLPALGFPEWAGKLVGLLVGGSVALACAILPLAVVKNRVHRIGEE